MIIPSLYVNLPSTPPSLSVGSLRCKLNSTDLFVKLTVLSPCKLTASINRLKSVPAFWVVPPEAAVSTKDWLVLFVGVTLN